MDLETTPSLLVFGRLEDPDSFLKLFNCSTSTWILTRAEPVGLKYLQALKSKMEFSENPVLLHFSESLKKSQWLRKQI